MDKRQILLDSVKKLLALEGVSEKDIIENLKSVGLSPEQSAELIKEAKGGKPSSEEEKQATPKLAEGFKQAKSKEFEDFEEEIIKGKGEPVEKEPEEKEEVAEEPEFEEELISEAEEEKEKKEKPKPLKERTASEEIEHADIGKLWETGVLTTVDAKLEEMKDLKRDIDAVIESRVQAAVEKESGKIKAFFDAQRELNSSKMEALVKEKTQEFSELVNSKVSELKQVNSAIQQASARLEAKQQVHSELLAAINEKVSEVEKLKARISSSASSEMAEAREKIEGFVKEAQKKLNDLDLRVTRTLELESKIAEGLLKDAENKIENIVDSKTAGIDRRISEKINELNSIQEKVDPKKVEDKLAQLVRDASKRLDEQVAGKIQPLSREVEAKINDLETLQSSVDPKVMESRLRELENRFQKDAYALRGKMEDFNLFKEQFINIVEKNTSTFNKAIKEFNDERLKQSKLIEAKMKELEDFEKKFAQEMGLMIEDMAKPKAEKKKK